MIAGGPKAVYRKVRAPGVVLLVLELLEGPHRDEVGGGDRSPTVVVVDPVRRLRRAKDDVRRREAVERQRRNDRLVGLDVGVALDADGEIGFVGGGSGGVGEDVASRGICSEGRIERAGLVIRTGGNRGGSGQIGDRGAGEADLIAYALRYRLAQAYREDEVPRAGVALGSIRGGGDGEGRLRPHGEDRGEAVEGQAYRPYIADLAERSAATRAATDEEWTRRPPQVIRTLRAVRIAARPYIVSVVKGSRLVAPLYIVPASVVETDVVVGDLGAVQPVD